MKSESSTVPLQRFNGEPSETELAVLLDPDGRSIYLRVEDSPEQLTVSPRGLPMWFFVSCACIPGIVFLVYLLFYKLPRDGPGVEILGIPVFAAAAIGGVAFGHFYNAQMCSKGPFLVVDKTRRTLWLPRSHVQLEPRDIYCFVEARGWHREQFGPRETSHTWIAELTVVARDSDGKKFVRYPVLACERQKSAHQVAKMLSDLFDVDHRLVKRHAP